MMKIAVTKVSIYYLSRIESITSSKYLKPHNTRWRISAIIIPLCSSAQLRGPAPRVSREVHCPGHDPFGSVGEVADGGDRGDMRDYVLVVC